MAAAPTEISTLSLHDALPISVKLGREAAEKCLSRADLKPEDIDLIITVSCTGFMIPRSEEHTSELQSHSDLVCRLLLEKKKKKNKLERLEIGKQSRVRQTARR